MECPAAAAMAHSSSISARISASPPDAFRIAAVSAPSASTETGLKAAFQMHLRQRSVTLPSAGNLGGGFMLIHDTKGGETVAVDWRAKKTTCKACGRA